MQHTFPTREAVSGYGLTTAHIIYHLPDNHPLLQEFLWQQYDLFPDFPALGKFLAFWQEKLDGPLHSVTVAHACLIRPTELSALRSPTRH